MNTLVEPLLPRRFDEDDYRLVGDAAARAYAAGLVNAAWYKCPVPRAVMKSLMQRGDAQAVRDTVLWYATLAACGVLARFALGTAWAVPAFMLYGALYCGPADSRWHEAGHGTAFKTRWMNDVLYQFASFQAFRRPTIWRWSHARHHTDTLVVGRDPEIAAPVPTRWTMLLGSLLALPHVWSESRKLLRNAAGRLTDDEKTFVPESEWPHVVREARVWLAIYVALPLACLAAGSWLPLLFVGGPSLYGAWLYVFFGLTQHAGLPENVTDHRLNCRTVYMNPVFRFLYWNMNYHLEHHMYPMVPFHALPRLHETIRTDTPPAYRSTVAAYAEILPALVRQTREPGWHVRRPLPASPQP
ncbi:MAG: fatty acid desaturase family protein [Betaproteobacteria bacterium]